MHDLEDDRLLDQSPHAVGLLGHGELVERVRRHAEQADAGLPLLEYSYLLVVEG